jgi:hypothetical protein
MRWWKLGVGLMAAWPLAACSGEAADDAPAAAEAEVVLARGTVQWGDGPGQRFDWDLETIQGYPHAVSFNATNDTRMSSASASRQGPDDHLWFVAATMGDGAPVIVFGGAAPGVDEVVLIDAQGIQVSLDLAPAQDLDWSVAVQELPAEWAASPPPALDVVALADGSEIARETLPGLI